MNSWGMPDQQESWEINICYENKTTEYHTRTSSLIFVWLFKEKPNGARFKLQVSLFLIQACPKVKPSLLWMQPLTPSGWLPSFHSPFHLDSGYMDAVWAPHTWEVFRASYCSWCKLLLLLIPFFWLTEVPSSPCLRMEASESTITPFHALLDVPPWPW